MSRAFSVSVLSLALLTSSSFARAQTPADPKAAAQALFEQARLLMNAGNYTDACPKLEASEHAAHGTGTLLNLADCYDKLGRSASAWRTFLNAAGSARAAGQEERAKLAELRASVLYARLTMLRLTVAQPAPPDLHVFRDAEELRPDSWNRPLPLDPGSYTLRAERGSRLWSQQVQLAEAGKTLEVAIPALNEGSPAVAPAVPAAVDTGKPSAPLPAASAPVAPPPTSAPPSAPPSTSAAPATVPAANDDVAKASSRRTWAYVLVGAGAVGLGVSTGLALSAKSTYTKSLDHCRTKDLCSQQGLDERNEAIKSGNFATVAFALGLASLGVGGYLYFSDDSAAKSSARVQVVPLVTSQQASLSLAGAY